MLEANTDANISTEVRTGKMQLLEIISQALIYSSLSLQNCFDGLSEGQSSPLPSKSVFLVDVVNNNLAWLSVR